MTVTILDCDGFDRFNGSTSITRWQNNNWTGASDNLGRWGGGCGTLGGSGNKPTKNLADAHQALLVKFDAWRSVLNAGTWCILMNGTTSIVDLRKNTDNTLYITRGGTTLATSTQVIALQQWHCIEINLYVHATAGRMIVRVNGEVWINFTGNTGASNINAVRFENGANSGSLYIDDFVVASGTDVENDRLGDIRIFTTIPTGAGNYTQFTPNTGANHETLDETGQGGDGDTTYNSSETVGHKDTFIWEDIAGAGIVLGVNVGVVARMDDVGPRGFKPLIRRGSDVVGSELLLSSSYGIFTQLWQTDPIAAAAWTLANFNNTEFGYQLTT